MRSRTESCIGLLALAVCALAAAAVPVGAVVVPERDDALGAKALRHPALSIRDEFTPAAALPATAAADRDLAALGVPFSGAWVDARGGRWGTLLPVTPLLPGGGVGNHLTWNTVGASPPADAAALERAAWQAFAGWVGEQRSALRIDPAELVPGRVTVREGGELIQIHAPRTVAGVPVRDSYLTAVVRGGNLILFGAHRWGDVEVSTRPALSERQAAGRLAAHLAPLAAAGAWGKPELQLVPTAGDKSGAYGHRLAWALRPSFRGELGRWEALVDAHSGEVILFEDTNHYATTRRVQGGVLPISSDGIPPDGVEQAGWPMPFADLDFGGSTAFTDAGGNLATCVDGNVTSNLDGRFVRMNDLCGAISLTSAGDVDFGTSAGTNCTTPGFGGAGNTHASRSGFHELNRIQEMARGQLPGNVWLQSQLTSNMNINQTCNAFWNGATVNFYREGGGCANTGELAGVFDHEWGHGMDDNDAVPTVSNPGEGVADIYAALRLNVSCIGRGFRLNDANCGGYGDPCTDCTGIRDIDFAKRASGQPHDVTWAGPACGSGGGTPCGGSTHCEGYVYSEAVWDLVHRDLPSVYGMDSNTALEVGTRLTYLGGGNVGTWFQCTTPFGGCAATGGYLNYLAADDDNANLNDGTPHMQAIFEAFDRHQIACGSPAVQDSGCAGAPSAAPSVSGTALDRGASLSWGAVAGATRYGVFRTDGVHACDFGKIKVGETTGTGFIDSGLQNGRAYSYVVIPIGGADTCMGPASACTTVTATAGPNLSIDAASQSLAIHTGDGDVFLDNCESATLSFDIVNIGAGSQTDVRITSAVPVSHPSIDVTGTSVTPSSLAACGVAVGSVDFDAAGLSPGDTVEFEVTVTSDELSPFSRTASLFVGGAESDFQGFASKTFTFEAGTEGWQVVQGTFDRVSAGGGANGTAWYQASSADLADQCDQVRSPLLRLTSTSTLSLSNQFDIEPIFQGSTWYDRANVGLYDVATGGRTAVSPSGGRQYNASGANGTCGTAGQGGWAGAATSWAQSTWSAAALGSAAAAGDLVQLDVRYGTDGSLEGFGFHFDEVTLTNVDVQAADGQSDVCAPAVCGNGVREGSEQCDGADLGGATCSDVGCSTGIVGCTLSCTLDFSGCSDCVVCGDGSCEAPEDCENCPTDCPIFELPGFSCGNGLCEAGDGENCVTCPSDCNGRQSGNPNNRFCCGFGGTNPVGCSDSRCNSNGFSCTTTPAGPGVSTCCGDLVCESPESSLNCPLDCGAPPACGDGTCDPGENRCSCASDCGLPPSSETGLCADGIDNDCDGATDCADLDCALDAACSGPVCGNGTCESGESCTTCSADCPGVTNGPRSGRFCCGNGVPEGPEGGGAICDGNF